MGFTQTTFLFVFLPASILIYLAVYRFSGRDIRACNIVLIAEGLLFYWWAEPRLALFYVSLTLLMYALCRMIHKAETQTERKEIMTFGVILLVFLPVIYKYLPSFRILDKDEAQIVMPLFRGMLVPVGISFFTMGAISYLADVYMNRERPGELSEVFLYNMLYPKAVCGPIVLWRDFTGQTIHRKTDIDAVSDGVKRIIIGYSKKVIIADTLAAQISLINAKMAAPTAAVADLPTGVDVASSWLLLILFFFRIYADFSGYSDIAIGLCRIFGFDIGENFNYPYLSGSVDEFWGRWHISFRNWFKTYVYEPLLTYGICSPSVAIIISFCIAAIWHGWRVDLLICGVITSLIVIAERSAMKKDWYAKVPRALRTALVLAWVLCCWMVLKSSSMESTIKSFRLLFVPAADVPNFTWRFFATKKTIMAIIIAALGSFGLLRKMAEMIKKKVKPQIYDILEKVVMILLLAIVIMTVISTSYTAPFYAMF